MFGKLVFSCSDLSIGEIPIFGRFRFEQVRVERLTKFSTYLGSEHIRNNKYLINLDSYHASSGIPSLELETLGCLP